MHAAGCRSLDSGYASAETMDGNASGKRRDRGGAACAGSRSGRMGIWQNARGEWRKTWPWRKRYSRRAPSAIVRASSAFRSEWVCASAEIYRLRTSTSSQRVCAASTG